VTTSHKFARKSFRAPRILVVISALALAAAPAARAESCQSSTDMDDATRTAITSAGQRYFDMVAKADVASLRSNAIPSLASDFSGIEGTVKGAQANLAGAQGAARPPFLLDATGVAPIAHAEFFCGLFTGKGQSATSAVFVLNNLPAGKYAIVIVDATAPKSSMSVSFVLQLVDKDWKVGGLYIKPRLYSGYDPKWLINRAREYKTKGQLHNAWLFYRAALNLSSPLPFMSTQATDNLYDESQPLLPADLPTDGKPADLISGLATSRLTDLFIDGVDNNLDLVVKFQTASVANTNQAYQENVGVMKALITKFPEFKDAFAGIVARAVDSTGHDYGTLLAMKDIK
jgi:hypothetical protein